MITLCVDKKYSGPDLIALEFLLPLSSDEVTAAWTNTKPEIQLLRKYPGRSFKLYVPDLTSMERASAALGIRFVVDRQLTKECALAINSSSGGKWRGFVADTGASVSRSATIGLLAEFIRQGKDTPTLRKVMVECVLDGTPPVDADVLLGLRLSGARV